MREKLCGIYKITNTVNGKCYVGKSENIHARFAQHKCELKYNRHQNFHLQLSVNKYNIKNFTFEILEIVTNINELGKREGFWVDRLKCLNRKFGYNKDDIDINTGKRIVSIETRKKLSENKKGKTASEISKRRMSESRKGRISWNTGIKFTEYQKRNLSQSKKKTYSIISPSYELIIFTGMLDFCKKHKLTNSYIFKLIRGEIAQYKGYTNAKKVIN